MQKEYKIFGKNFEQETLDQFFDVMGIDDVVSGALMPDAHLGYVLPIGGVVATMEKIYPAFIGYDIGCGVLAYKTEYKKSDLSGKEKNIFDGIYKSIPCGEGKYRNDLINWDWKKLKRTNIVDDIMKLGEYQIGTLGGGNHFIEIAYDEDDNIWIVIHSGSRGVGHKVATYYMELAKGKELVNNKEYENEFDNNDFGKMIKERDIEKYEELKANYVEKRIKEVMKGTYEGKYGINVDSSEGKDYIKDMNFCLDFALQNRLEMLKLTKKVIDFNTQQKTPKEIVLEKIINRNHNHAEYKNGYWIHRKGATHAEKGMLGVIPGNMRDGSFIVEGKGNPDSLSSSSHGGGRLMSRAKAKANFTIEDFEIAMRGIVAKVDNTTLDENPMAYKNIFEVMELQKDLIQVLHHLKPLINVKG